MLVESADFFALFRVFQRWGVEYLVIGGVAATLHGVPLNTFDLDILPSRAAANRERLLAALQEIDAIYREHRARKLAPTLEKLDLPGTHLLATCLGPLDVLGTVGDGWSYEDLLGKSILCDLGDDLQVRVVELEVLIELKEKAGREKDRLALPILRHTLEERRRLEQGERCC